MSYKIKKRYRRQWVAAVSYEAGAELDREESCLYCSFTGNEDHALRVDSLAEARVIAAIANVGCNQHRFHPSLCPPRCEVRGFLTQFEWRGLVFEVTMVDAYQIEWATPRETCGACWVLTYLEGAFWADRVVNYRGESPGDYLYTGDDAADVLDSCRAALDG